MSTRCHRTARALAVLLAAWLLLHVAQAQASARRPPRGTATERRRRLYPRKHRCLADQVEACRMDCLVQYQDPRRFLCPCYSKLGDCLVRIGCSLKQRVDVATFCSRRGYCKDGYCDFRAGDLTPRGDTRPEVFELMSVKTPDTPCIDNCCPTWTNCSQDTTMVAVRSPGRLYREEEVSLPPRE
uniref:Uncharacterized protein n=1 Tax=Phytophthora ramorum TaxID=164328 RepID=H3GJY1_PHYRM